MALVSGVGVPAGAVFDTMELQNDPSFDERGIMQVMEHPNGAFKMPRDRCGSTASRRGSNLHRSWASTAPKC